MADIKRAVKKLVEEFKEADGWRKSEEGVQSGFTLELLRRLGWSPVNWQINTGTSVKTGKKPDIVLKDDAGFTVLVIESKAPKRELGLKTQEEQLFRYAAHEGKYWGILTNFVEWRVYATHPPCIYKKFAFHGLLKNDYLKKEYIDLMSPEGLDFLASLERETLCAAHGRFDEAEVYYPPQEEIRREFFDKLRKWRKELRRELYKNYGKKRGAEEVDLGTQKILDRLIFIEVCTDKEILSRDVLASVLTARGRYYRELKREFGAMDELFDTELFAENWVDRADVTDKTIEPIIRGVADVEFKRLPVHVIGEVYEDYLGELVREKGRGVSVKETKVARKSKGIYYTPEYIVDYIVKNTVGELLKKAKAEEDIKKVRVLDPACGSGSFLIRAFDEFAAAYERVLNKKGTATLFGFDVKRSILENNIYGVDIDPRAVEITKLNLMIKALEKTKYQDLKGRKLLPNLSLNIRCGNSLVSGDETADKEGQLAIFGAEHEAEAKKLITLRERFYRTRDDDEKKVLLEGIFNYEYEVNDVLNEGLREYFDDPAEEKPFNYTVAFPEVFRAGGFDAVIGNPPYGALLDDQEVNYLNSKFVLQSYQLDTYLLFVEKGGDLIRLEGRLGMIIPNTWLLNLLSKSIRKYILESYEISNIVHYKDKVFVEATVDTEIIILRKRKPGRDSKVYITLRTKDGTSVSYYIPQQIWISREGDPVNILEKPEYSIIKRKIERFPKLNDVSVITQGAKPFQVGKGKPKQTRETVDEKPFVQDYKKDNTFRPLLRGSLIRRYLILWDNNYWISLGDWLAEPRYSANFDAPQKIVIRQTGDSLIATLDEKQFIVRDNLYTIVPSREDATSKFLLGLVNSTLMNWYYQNILNPEKGEALAQIKRGHIARLPIRLIDFGNRTDVARHDKMVAFVEEMLELHKRLNAARADTDKRRLERAIKVTDKKIDALVYELYGLTAEEIKIVEGS